MCILIAKVSCTVKGTSCGLLVRDLCPPLSSAVEVRVLLASCLVNRALVHSPVKEEGTSVGIYEAQRAGLKPFSPSSAAPALWLLASPLPSVK